MEESNEETAARAGEVTLALKAVAGGDEGARERLWELVYDELRCVAGNLMRGKGSPDVLQPTALVNEAFLRLFGGAPPSLQDRAHFKAASAVVMRRILVDAARERKASKRGGEWQRVSLREDASQTGLDLDVLALEGALQRLAELNARHSRVIELRYFGGLTLAETAEELGVSTQTVKTDWAGARAWLFRELQAD